MSRICDVCGDKIPFFKIRIKDGFMCGTCQNKLPLNDYSKKETYTAEEIRGIIKRGEDSDNSKPDIIQAAITKFKGGDAKEDDRFEQMREYKKLLDEGIITEEEYERKKKELLDL